MRTSVSSSARMRGMSSLTRSPSVAEEAWVFLEKMSLPRPGFGRTQTTREYRFRCDWTWYPRDIDPHARPKLNAPHEEPHLAENLGVHWLRDLRAHPRVLLDGDRDRRRCGGASWVRHERRLALDGGRDIAGPAP